MGGEWDERGLAELAELIVDCPHSTPKWTDTGVVVLRSQNIRNGRLDLRAPSFTTESGYLNRVRRAVPAAGDLVLTREAPMGEVCLIPEGIQCCLGQRMVLIRANTEVLHPKYLLYCIQSPFVQNQISWNEGTGTTVSNIRIPVIEGFRIPTPPLIEQKAIANILGVLDDKIELNRQTNQTLEAMAQALFKSWFVDFDPVIDNALAAGNDIPEPLKARAAARQALGDARKPLPEEIRREFSDGFEFRDEMGWVPRGWGVASVEELIQINPKTLLSRDVLARYTDMKALPVSGFSIDGFEMKPYRSGAKFINGDVLLARITPCLENGKTGVVDYLEDDEVGFGSTEFVVLRRKEMIGSGFIACLARDAVFRTHCIQSMVGSSGRQRVQTSCFSDYYLCVPPGNDLLARFEEFSSSCFERTRTAQASSNCLAAVRDTLLPKLLSGELTIPDAEKLAADVL